MSRLQEKHPLNPFTNRGLITNPDEFFGREQEIGEIISRLRAMQSLSVVGERRIGKSSPLYHLYQTGRLRIADPAYCFFYFDLPDARFHTAAGFLRAILQRLELESGAVSEGLKQPGESDFEQRPFTRLAEYLDGVEEVLRRVRKQAL